MNNLQTLIEAAGYTRYNFAAAYGIHRQSVYDWCSGKSRPNWSNIEKLCRVLKCNISDIYFMNQEVK